MNFKRFFIAFILAFFLVNLSYAVVSDSIGIEHENGTIIVLHQVEPKETLYSLSQRYGTPIESIVENNQIRDNNLSVGTILRIPWTHSVTHMVEPGQTLYSLSKSYQVSVEDIKKLNGLSSNDLEAGSILYIVKTPQTTSEISQATSNTGYHVVAQEETLYSISKKYDIDIDKIISWNQLNGNYVQAGDTLLLEETEIKTSPSNRPPADPPKVTSSSRDAVPVQEKGIAAVISGSTDTKKYLALHPTAPFGTIMKVRNEMTNLSVFVRVVGQLPATGANNNVLIRLSPAAQEALGALDDKFRVELSYVSP